MSLTKLQRRARIKKRIRKIISGSAATPRMNVYRSNKQISVQFIDDNAGKTVLSVSSLCKEIASLEGSKSEIATVVGKKAAEAALAAGITQVVFDRNGYLYHGRVKAVAEAARENGLKF
ncbi:50S ribosomal protein L18 [Halosquirtibacter xylanolyticus]|uniref:50S ribosomal protein L18 n=1 Tax=Halosquirtibacter xylanolyticus TaxID=3374599 RepID=UPI00374792BE|nr:50S ribosomal protein L18 [Prolixibacteraceae bacterium]